MYLFVLKENFKFYKIFKNFFKNLLIFISFEILKKNNFLCYISESYFLRFCCLFLKHFVQISDTLQRHILREKLMFYIMQFLEAHKEYEKVAKKRAQNHDFFILSFLKFYIFSNFFFQFLYNFKGKKNFLYISKGIVKIFEKN